MNFSIFPYCMFSECADKLITSKLVSGDVILRGSSEDVPYVADQGFINNNGYWSPKSTNVPLWLKVTKSTLNGIHLKNIRCLSSGQ